MSDLTIAPSVPEGKLQRAADADFPVTIRATRYEQDLAENAESGHSVVILGIKDSGKVTESDSLDVTGTVKTYARSQDAGRNYLVFGHVERVEAISENGSESGEDEANKEQSEQAERSTVFTPATTQSVSGGNQAANRSLGGPSSYGRQQNNHYLHRGGP